MKIEEGTPHATAEGVEPVRSGANELVATGNRFLPLRGTKATVKYHVCEQKVFSALRALAQLPTLLRVCGEGQFLTIQFKPSRTVSRTDSTRWSCMTRSLN